MFKNIQNEYMKVLRDLNSLVVTCLVFRIHSRPSKHTQENVLNIKRAHCLLSLRLVKSCDQNLKDFVRITNYHLLHGDYYLQYTYQLTCFIGFPREQQIITEKMAGNFKKADVV